MNIVIFHLKLIYDRIKWCFKRLVKKPKSMCFEKVEFNYQKAQNKIEDWQVREKQLGGVSTLESDVLPPDWKSTAKKINNWVNKNIKYISDQENWGVGDYWPTSKEVFDNGSEDCDGQAILKWRLLADRGFTNNKIMLVAVNKHIFTGICDGDDFWVLDNGSITYSVQKASKTLPYIDNKLLFGFNLYNKWGY